MQARTMKYFMATTGIVAAMACADDRTVSPTPVGPSADVVAAAPATGCDFSQMRKDGRAWFASSQDPVFDLITLGSQQYSKGGVTAFLPTGWAILSRVEQALATPGAISGPPAAGDAFIRDDLLCMGYSVAPGTFTGAVATNGLFGVRSGTSTLPVTSRGTPKYGAEPTPTGGVWGVSQLFLLFGNAITFAFTNEPPGAAIASEMSTIPAGLTFNPFIRVGICQTTAATPRIQHYSSTQFGGPPPVILAPETPNFCNATASAQRDQGGGVFAFARRLTDWIAPRPLFAATAVLGGMGGSLGGLSPIGAVQVDGSTVTLTFTVQPSNGSINQPITPAITVKAATASGIPLDGVQVTLTALSNVGSFTLSGNVATTTGGGIATFPNFQTNKAGGYTLTASGLFGTTATQSATSVLFQVNGQQ